MFARPNHMNAMSDSGRKRFRECEDDTATVGFGEHRNKRIHCLPLRASLKSPALAQQDAEPDMLESSSPYHVDVGMHCSNQSAGRMGTPMQPTFAVQLRGQQCEWAGPGPVLSDLSGVDNLSHYSSGFSDDQCVPRAMSGVADWHAIQNNRRIPCPISEASPALSHGVASLDMMLDDDGNVAMVLEDAVSATPLRAMEHPNAMMELESSPTQQADRLETENSSSPSGSVRRGHVRSKHTIDSWTWQPGMKKSFSIGYRSDCEKCRLKVPGHFNHIVIS